jgi:short subunit dehydrogenase-like uncharacterized protein
MHSSSFIIYGAYGFTGQLVAELAASKGLQPILAGRDEAKTKAIAEKLNLPWEAFSLDDTETLNRMVKSVDVLLNCAGPYSATAKPAMIACLKNNCHYIDITGEMEVFEYAASLNAAAQEAGIVIIPGCGFDVVPTDCLAAFLHAQMTDASHLELAFKGAGSLSRGTALTVVENIYKGGMIRQNGELKAVPTGWKTRQIDYGKGPRISMSIPWGDVSTAYYSTGIPNIIVYTGVAPKAIRFAKLSRYFTGILKSNWVQNKLKNYVRKNIKGPTEELREKTQSHVWGEVRNAGGKTLTASLTTPEAYKLTAITALMATEKILKNTPDPGFKTPSLAFGPDFILEVEGVSRQLHQN